MGLDHAISLNNKTFYGSRSVIVYNFKIDQLIAYFSLCRKIFLESVNFFA